MGDILFVSTADVKEHHLENGSLCEQDPEGLRQAEIYAFNKIRCITGL